MERTYAEYAARQAMELLAIDSPTGFTARAAGARACCWRLTPTRWAAWWRR